MGHDKGTDLVMFEHCFIHVYFQGERLSHAVGCAFAICLERKQKRDKESTTNVAVTYSQDRTTFERTGSFRQTTMTERLTDPQSAILAGMGLLSSHTFENTFSAVLKNHVK